MKNKTILTLFISLFFVLFCLSCGEDDGEEPLMGIVTGCNTFTFQGNSFELPSGNCSSGNIIDFDITENGETFKFKITCNGTCISEVEAR